MNEQAGFLEDPRRALREYAASGYHVEPNVFEHSMCERLIDVANGFPAVRGGDFRTVLQPHRMNAAFLEALRHPAVTRIVRQLIGERISGIQTQFFYCKPGTPGFQAHQDNRFVNAPQSGFASAWIALTDVSPTNGGLVIYPGSHKEPLLEVNEVAYQETVLQDANALRLRCAIPEHYEPLDLRMAKGSAVFFDGHTVHASHANRSDACRYALLLTYVRQGANFTAGRYAQRDAVPVD